MQNMNIVVEIDEEIFKICLDEKIFNLWSDLKLTLTLSLTLGLGLGLTLGKTIGVENLKPNAKHQYRRKRPGKNL